MLFFFKEKPIEITAVIHENYVVAHKTAPIVPARERFPDWWKKIPSSKFDWDEFGPSTSIKSCPGVGHTLQQGFIMSLWSDLAFKFEGDTFRWRFSDNRSETTFQPRRSYPGFYEDYNTFNILSPWIMLTPVKLHYSYPFYLLDSPPPYITPPGVVTPFLNTCATNVFAMFKQQVGLNTYFIKKNTPMLHIIPLTEKKINFKCEILDDKEYNKHRSAISTPTHFVSKGLKHFNEEEKLKRNS